MREISTNLFRKANLYAWPLTLTVFVGDCIVPANILFPLLYIILLFLNLDTERNLWMMALTSVFLTILAPLIGAPPTPGANLVMLWLNRVMASVSILSVAYALNRKFIAEEERDAAEKDLRDAVRAREIFLATLSHELRNPLAPLRSGVAALQRSKVTDERLLSLMDRQINQLVRLVDDLLDLSRIRGGKMQLKRCSIDLAEIANLALEACRTSIDGAHQQVVVDIPLDLPRIKADPARVTQALTNLLDNASKFTPERGSIAISIKAEGNDVAVSVKDSGRGISAEALPDIFTLFMRERGLAETRGLGIGLALVKEVAELHGGRAEAHSDGIGKGANFTIRLPTSSEESKRSTTQADLREAPLGQARPGA